MGTAQKRFRIDILDSSGNKLGDRPITNVATLTITERLDRIGSANFTIPASDPIASQIVPGVRFDIFEQNDDYLGRFLYKTDSIDENQGAGIMNVQAWDELKELTLQTVGLGRDYAAEAVEDIIAELVPEVSSWTTDTDIGIGTSNVTYQGQTVYDAIEELANRWGLHFRLGTTSQTLEFKQLGVLNTDIRFLKLPAQDSDIEQYSEVAFISKIRRRQDDQELFNRIIALGAGVGSGQLTLEGATGTLYTVQNRTPTGALATSQTLYYIEDAVSVAAYGLRELIVLFDTIKPVANTTTAKNQARAELINNAETFLTQHKDPRIEYSCEVVGVQSYPKVGDLVQIFYRGKGDYGVYLDIDENLFVMDITKIYDASGNRNASFKFANIDQRQTDDNDIIASTVKAVRSQKLLIQPESFRFENTYRDSGQYFTGGTDIGKDASFRIDIDDTVLDVTRCIVRWKTEPLWNGAIADNWGPATVTAGTVPAQPTRSVWALALGDLWPKNITMKINGINVNNHVDIDYLVGGTGAWNSGGSDAETLVEMDITDFILNLGIYTGFDITFEFGSTGSENVAYPGSNTDPITVVGGGSHGFIELTIKMQGIAQAIYDQ